MYKCTNCNHESSEFNLNNGQKVCKKCGDYVLELNVQSDINVEVKKIITKRK